MLPSSIRLSIRKALFTLWAQVFSFVDHSLAENEKILRKLLLRVVATVSVVAFSGFPVSAQFTIDPGQTRIAPGGSFLFKASAAGAALSTSLTWDLQPAPPPAGFTILPEGTTSTALLTISEDATIPASGLIVVRASGNGQVATAIVQISTQPGGLIVIPVIGFEQAGASSAQTHQKFFFNFFVSRPFPHANSGYTGVDDAGRVFGPKLRWWGDVRIASYAQQVTSGVGVFATGFATQVAQLQVNKLAQAGEFNTGIDCRLTSFPGFFPSIAWTSKERTQLSLVVGFGAISPFNPTESLEIFKTPPSGSSQRDAFLKLFPSSANFLYTGFTTPDRDRFYWQYGAGLRLTTQFFDQSGLQRGSPAMITYSLGQNQLVSGGISRGLVQRLEAFFPLPLGEVFKDNSLYLFGRVDMRIAAPHQTTPFILEPADATITGFNPQVNIVSMRSNRDIYTIGVGVDAVKLMKTITGQSNKNP
jgi:hypothetical protein